MRALALVLSLIVLGVAAESQALFVLQNRLSNSDFDANLDAWIEGGLQANWADLDEDGDPNSGAVRIDVNGEAGAVRSVSQCITIVGGDFHSFGTQYLIPTGQIPSGQVRLNVSWYDELGCVGLLSSDVPPSTEDFDVVGTWTSLTDAATPDVNADSARLTLSGWKLVGQEQQPDFVVYFDDAVLAPEPDAALAAITAIAALLARRGSSRRLALRP